MKEMLSWLQASVPAVDEASIAAAQRRQSQLTKPAGSLGQLETLAVRLAGMQARECPQIERVHISVFAADHGVAAENVSAYPQSVTAQMIDNFVGGGAAISVLARHLGATLEVIDLGTVAPSQASSGVRREVIAPGSANLAVQAAMTYAQLGAAMTSGRAAVLRAVQDHAQLFIGGEMGIANTTAATVLACAVLQRAATELVGPGTGLNDVAMAHKAEVIARALTLHAPRCDTPLEMLRRLGGFEIAALCGACISAAQHRLPMLIDGFIVSVAALIACRICPQIAPRLLYAHRSAEPGHRAVLEALKARPLLDLDLRLGEGSGAAIAVPLLQMACALHAQMATFADAGVDRATDTD